MRHVRTIFTTVAMTACVAALLPVKTSAHEVTSLNGQKSTHQHVYKRNAYGKGATAGHYARPAGSHGIVIWSASPTQAYGKTLNGFRMPGSAQGQPSQKSLYTQDPLIERQLQPQTGSGKRGQR